MAKRYQRSSGCFLIGVTGDGWSKNGQAIIGSVSDDPYDIRTFVRVYKTLDGYGHVGTELISTTDKSLSDRGYFARPNETTRGLNEKGLAFTCSMVIEDENSKSQRINNSKEYSDITRKMLLECEKVSDAISLFKEAGAINPAYTVLLCDKSGDLAHLEAGSYGIRVLHLFGKSNPGAVFGVNCYRHTDLDNFNDQKTTLTNTQNNNLTRLQRGQHLSEKYKGEFDVEVISKILSDHQSIERDPMENPVLNAWGYSICNHGTRKKDDYPQNDLPWGTVSAEIVSPNSGLFWYAYGWPCGSSSSFGDQLFQDNSWGRFVPFRHLKDEHAQGYHAYTTSDGKILPLGIRAIACSET